MSDVTLACEAANCGATKTAPDMASCIALMQLHQANVHDAAPRQRPPKTDRPSLRQGIGDDEWAAFTRRWEVFRNSTDMAAGQVIAQLLACCDSALEIALFRQDPGIAGRTEASVLGSLKQLAVVSVALSARRAAMLQTTQDGGEPVRQYVARLRGLAGVCQWSQSGPCSQRGCPGVNQVDYTEEIVRMTMLNGLADRDIRREVLGTADIDEKSLEDTVAVVDGKETAARAEAADTPRVAASAYKRQQGYNYKGAAPKDTASDQLRKQFRCACGAVTSQFGRVRGRLLEFTECRECWRRKHARRRVADGPHATDTRQNPETAMFETISSLEVVDGEPSAGPTINSVSGERGGFISLSDHYVFNGTRGWKSGAAAPHPTLSLQATVDVGAYDQLGLPAPPRHSAEVSAVADSGAQTCLMGLPVLRRLGLRRSHLTRVTKRILAANSEEISVLGVVFLQLSGPASPSQTLTTSAMVYVTDSTDRFYLSRAALTDLGVLEADFPKIGAAGGGEHAAASCESGTSPDAQAEPRPTTTTTAGCGCPRRSPPPGRPSQLPFAPDTHNRERMKAWLLERYAASTFNTCPHQPLPTMTGPPMEIRVDPNARPIVTKRPPHVAIHWQREVAEHLERDVALGVIERVPANTPVTWLHNMVVTPKADGSPRRTVDLQALNRSSVREAHHVVPPVKQARAIPARTVKTVVDAWNGFHAINIRPEDRHLTTFITEQGRFRYRRAPMGFMASQDAYTARYDAIISDVPRRSKCVDDTVLWDEDLSAHWWRIIDYLELVGRHGVILNPTKLQFSSTEVDFAGFRVTATGVKPLPRYLDAIAAFPTPRSITDVRAWFGLVNQLSGYGRTTELMAPFKPLLSPKVRFRWDADLDRAFTRSKAALIQAVEEGVEIFDPERKTCVSPDWSTAGVGYWVHQQHCECRSLTPGCCPTGWRVTLVGSRFLRGPEQRYAPVEGEALAVAWALEDCRFFTLGCRDLIIATDHKPLVRLLGDRALDDIHNPRLFRIKQRTLMWRYRIVHVPGKDNAAADTASRYPPPESHPQWESDNAALAAIRREATDGIDSHDDLEVTITAVAVAATHALGAVTWARVRHATRQDADLCQLTAYVVSGFPVARDDLPQGLQRFWQHRDALCMVDGVVMRGNRVVVPTVLREEVLQALHSAHQGVGKMTDRALDTVFWPGLTQDLEQVRANCQECWRIAPSQPALPPASPQVPTRPFQAIAADFFVLRGVGYLVIVDRFSGWPHIVASLSGALGFRRALLRYFGSYGVPEEISTDGGPEFIAHDTEDLLRRWGVRHRLSSAYYPRSNGRAEVAVKSVKRLLASHRAADGNIDTETVTAGLLQFRNTPDPATGLSAAQVVFGRNLRDLLPIAPQATVFDSPAVHPVWRETWACREQAMRVRFAKQTEELSRHAQPRSPLSPGATVLVQNQAGPHPTRWDRTGVVVEAKPHDQYAVKVHGSGRVTLRNRRFLRPIVRLPPFEPPVAPIPTGPRPAEARAHPTNQPGTTTDPPDADAVAPPRWPAPVMPAAGPPTAARPDDPQPADDPPPPMATPASPGRGDTLPRAGHRLRRPPAYLQDYEVGGHE